MKTEMGEFIVGAYLQQQLHCDFVGYNVRPAIHGLEGLAEMDVVGLRFLDRHAFLCEVATHLDGLQYGTYEKTISKLKEKFDRQKSYALRHLKNFDVIHHVFWSPIVRSRVVIEALRELATQGLEVVINDTYTKRFNELEEAAKATTRDTGNPFFRVLQLRAHLRPLGYSRD